MLVCACGGQCHCCACKVYLTHLHPHHALMPPQAPASRESLSQSSWQRCPTTKCSCLTRGVGLEGVCQPATKVCVCVCVCVCVSVQRGIGERMSASYKGACACLKCERGLCGIVARDRVRIECHAHHVTVQGIPTTTHFTLHTPQMSSFSTTARSISLLALLRSRRLSMSTRRKGALPSGHPLWLLSHQTPTPSTRRAHGRSLTTSPFRA
jgi:hypothetical protein